MIMTEQKVDCRRLKGTQKVTHNHDEIGTKMAWILPWTYPDHI